jgi:hypothetical protein
VLSGAALGWVLRGVLLRTGCLGLSFGSTGLKDTFQAENNRSQSLCGQVGGAARLGVAFGKVQRESREQQEIRRGSGSGWVLLAGHGCAIQGGRKWLEDLAKGVGRSTCRKRILCALH